MSGNAGGAGGSGGNTSKITEELFPDILKIVSNQGFARNLKNRGSIRAVSKTVKEGINKYDTHIQEKLTGLNQEQYRPTANSNTKNKFISILISLIRGRNREAIDKLLSTGQYATSLFERDLINADVLDIPLYEYTALFEAVKIDDLETVKQLLKLGANPNGKRYPRDLPLEEQGARVAPGDPRRLEFPTTNEAAFNGNLPILQALVEAGGNINAWAGHTGGEDAPLVVSLECALYGQNRQLCGGKYKWQNDKLNQKYSIDNKLRRENPEQLKKPSLFQKYIQIFDWILTQKNVDVNVRGGGNRTPLRSAVELAILFPTTLTRLVEKLLQKGANPDISDNMGFPQLSARQVVNSRGSEKLKALFASVPVGGYPVRNEINAGGSGGAVGGAAGGASSGGGRRKKTNKRRKNKKQTKRRH